MPWLAEGRGTRGTSGRLAQRVILWEEELVTKMRAGFEPAENWEAMPIRFYRKSRT